MSLSATARYTPRSDVGQFIKTFVVPGLLDAVGAAGRAVEEEAKAICPVDTGVLRDSIASRVDQATNSVYATVYATAPYAGYVEFGTGIRGAESDGAGPYPYNPKWPGMAAQPFLRPALDTRRQEIKDAFLQFGGVYLGGNA